MTDIATNLINVKKKIAAAAASEGRKANSVELVAVSKGQESEKVRAAIIAGHRAFGENRVQEAKNKFGPLRGLCTDIELHLIGPLQTNKAEEAVKLFDVIETLDRPRLAEALSKAIQKTGRTLKFYVQVNIGNEEQKAGVALDQLDTFLSFCRKSCGLKIEGLMCIPPHKADPRPYFLQMKDLNNQYKFSHLSMGMSDDYEIAVRCGATAVRVGTAVFGKREVRG